jgi:HSP20 family protein
MPIILTWNPTDNLFVVHETFSQVMDQVSSLLQKRKSAEMTSAWAPIADMYENDEAFVLHVELAGIEQESLEILFQECELLIRGKRPFHPHMQSAKIHRIERMYGVFQRIFRIPAPIDAQAITASYDRGVLSIHLPKLQHTDVEQMNISMAFH